MILVAGVGNIFLGDDGFGSEVARRALRLASPNVRVVDFGIRGLDLVYALLDGYDATVIIDALPCGGEPGTICVIEPDLDQIKQFPVGAEAHSMDPMRVLALAHCMGAQLNNIRIVGCEPETFGTEDAGYMGLSPRVSAAVEQAIDVVGSLLEEIIPRCSGGKP